MAAIIVLAFVTDLPRTMIEILDLPVPRLGGNPPYLLPAALVLIGAYLRFQGVKVREMLEPVDLVLLLAVVLTALIECLHWAGGKTPQFHMVAEALWWTVAYYAVKHHIRASGEVQSFARAALAFIIVLTSTHLVALVIARADGFADESVVGEISGRNGISLLLTAGVYIQWFVLERRAGQPRWQALFVPALALVHTLANGTRAALVVLLLLAIARLATGSRLRKPILAMLVASVGLGALSVSVGYEGLGSWTPFTQRGTGTAASVGDERTVGYRLAPNRSLIDRVRHNKAGARLVATTDDERSVGYRLAANRSLIERIRRNPVMGVGQEEALQTRAGGYPSHTYYLLVLAAYGMIGLIAYAVAIGLAICPSRRNSEERAVVLVMFAVTVFTFVNDLYYWLAMLAAMVSVSRGGSKA